MASLPHLRTFLRHTRRLFLFLPIIPFHIVHALDNLLFTPPNFPNTLTLTPMPKRSAFFQSLLDFTPKPRLLRPGLEPTPRPSISAAPAPSRAKQPSASNIADAFAVAHRISRGQRPTPPRRSEEDSLPSHVLQNEPNSVSRQEATSRVAAVSDDDFEPASTGKRKKRPVSRTSKLRDDRGSMTYRSDNKRRRGKQRAMSGTNDRNSSRDKSVRRLFREEHSLSGTDNECPDDSHDDDKSDEDKQTNAEIFDADFNPESDRIDLRGNTYGKGSGEINLDDSDVLSEPSMLQLPVQPKKRRKTKRRIHLDTDSENEVPLHATLKQGEPPKDDTDGDLPLTSLSSGSPTKITVHAQSDFAKIVHAPKVHMSKSTGTDHSSDDDKDDDVPIVRRRVRIRPRIPPESNLQRGPRTCTTWNLDDNSDDDRPLIQRRCQITAREDSDTGDDQDVHISPVASKRHTGKQGKVSFSASCTAAPTSSRLRNGETPVSEVIDLSNSLDGQPCPSTPPQTPSPFVRRRGRRIELPDSTPSPPSTRKRRPRQRLQTLPNAGDELPLESPLLRARAMTKPAKPLSKNAASPPEKWFCERNIEDFSDTPEFELRTPRRNAPSSAGRRRVSVRVKRSVPSGKSIKPSIREGINVVDEVESLCDSEDAMACPTPTKRKRQTALEPVHQEYHEDSIQIVDDCSLSSSQNTQRNGGVGRITNNSQSILKKSMRKILTQTRLDFGSQVEPRTNAEKSPKTSKKTARKASIRKKKMSGKDTFFNGSQNSLPGRLAAPVNSGSVVILDNDEEDFMDLVDVPDNVPNLHSTNGRSTSRPRNDAALDAMNNLDTDKPPPFNLIALCENGESVLQMMERLGEEFVIDKVSMAQKEGREIVGGEELGMTPQAQSQAREGEFSRFLEKVVPDGIGKEAEMHSVTEQAMRGEFQFNYRGRGRSPDPKGKATTQGRARGRGGRGYYARRWRGRRK